MLKRISVNQLTLGMHLKEFCGSYLDHPFWRTGFVLTSQKDLTAILESNIKELWIDCDKGLDVAAGESAVSEVEDEALVAEQQKQLAQRQHAAPSLAHGDHDLLRECLFDETHVPFRMRLAPGMPEAARAGRDAGAAGVTISGHGPALLAFAGSDQDARKIADAMIGAFAAHGITSRAEVARAAPRF